MCIRDSAWASSVLDPSLRAQLASIVSPFDLPPKGQEYGWHIWMGKDLQTILGRPVKGKFTVRYCGRGSLTRCRAVLWAAMDQAGTQLAASQGANPAAWRSDATRERIKFIPGLLPFTMRYANRPSGDQQVLSFTGHAPADTGR